MANLELLFERAETELPGLKRRRTQTQEVLELAGVQGVAWRPLSGARVLQIYPPTKGRETFREGNYFLVKNRLSECRYHDPDHDLKGDQWSYVGCDCSKLSEGQVWGWIKQAYQNLKRDKAARFGNMVVRSATATPKNSPIPHAVSKQSEGPPSGIASAPTTSTYEPVACWHHGNLERLRYHLAHNRIDLWGPEELSRTGQNRLRRWWSRMRLRTGDKIRIVVEGKIVCTAVIKSEPWTLPPSENNPPWGSAVDLDYVRWCHPPQDADCPGTGFGSHRLDTDVREDKSEKPNGTQTTIAVNKAVNSGRRQMETNLYTIEISEGVYKKFYQVVSTKWKSSETYAQALQSAAEAALMRFADDLEDNDKGTQ